MRPSVRVCSFSFPARCAFKNSVLSRNAVFERNVRQSVRLFCGQQPYKHKNTAPVFCFEHCYRGGLFCSSFPVAPPPSNFDQRRFFGVTIQFFIFFFPSRWRWFLSVLRPRFGARLTPATRDQVHPHAESIWLYSPRFPARN